MYKTTRDETKMREMVQKHHWSLILPMDTLIHICLPESKAEEAAMVLWG